MKRREKRQAIENLGDEFKLYSKLFSGLKLDAIKYIFDVRGQQFNQLLCVSDSSKKIFGEPIEIAYEDFVNPNKLRHRARITNMPPQKALEKLVAVLERFDKPSPIFSLALAGFVCHEGKEGFVLPEGMIVADGLCQNVISENPHIAAFKMISKASRCDLGEAKTLDEMWKLLVEALGEKNTPLAMSQVMLPILALVSKPEFVVHSFARTGKGKTHFNNVLDMFMGLDYDSEGRGQGAPLFKWKNATTSAVLESLSVGKGITVDADDYNGALGTPKKDHPDVDEIIRAASDGISRFVNSQSKYKYSPPVAQLRSNGESVFSDQSRSCEARTIVALLPGVDTSESRQSALVKKLRHSFAEEVFARAGFLFHQWVLKNKANLEAGISDRHSECEEEIRGFLGEKSFHKRLPKNLARVLVAAYIFIEAMQDLGEKTDDWAEQLKRKVKKYFYSLAKKQKRYWEDECITKVLIDSLVIGLANGDLHLSKQSGYLPPSKKMPEKFGWSENSPCGEWVGAVDTKDKTLCLLGSTSPDVLFGYTGLGGLRASKLTPIVMRKHLRDAGVLFQEGGRANLTYRVTICLPSGEKEVRQCLKFSKEFTGSLLKAIKQHKADGQFGHKKTSAKRKASDSKGAK